MSKLVTQPSFRAAWDDIVCLLFSTFSNVCHSPCVWPTDRWKKDRDRETEKERKGKKRIEDLKNGEMQQRILNLPSKSKGDILE